MMAVQSGSSSQDASSSNVQAPQPGVRAKTAMTVIQRASEMVVNSINLNTMEQSFSDFVDNEEDKQFIKLLTEKTAEHLNLGFQVCG